MMTFALRPKYDDAIIPVMAMLRPEGSPSLSAGGITAQRESAALWVEDLTAFDVLRSEHRATGHEGAFVDLTLFRPRSAPSTAPCIFIIHGGGMVLGDRLNGIAAKLAWAVELGAAVATVEYRLAPEFPDPYPVEDCFGGFLWLADQAEDLGIDPARIVLLGSSAGGGIAAGVALLARDRQTAQPAGLLLEAPMLDDRDSTTSSRQFAGVGLWDRESNIVGWSALLGDRRATADVSPYAAPARAESLAGLPPMYLDVGSAELFRDEVVEFASQVWADGGEADLHVWTGGCHGFELIAPTSRIGSDAVRARVSWLKSRFSGPVEAATA